MTIPPFEALSGDLTVDFPEYLDPPEDPIPLLASRVKRAMRVGVREPLAMTLATASETGQPSVRTMVISEVSDRGIIFATHSTSRKGRELAANPCAAALLYWRETSEQIAIRGRIDRLPDETARQLWSARPLFTHAMSTASRQSQPLMDVERLRSVARGFAQMAPLDKPATYTGYELIADEVEFWANGRERLHERLLYRWSGASWAISRLQP
ncbi:pyridoxal 5'-phosphate synthase [Pseudomonas mangiferae]|uniref:Pyridoxamine 5'-phosphate oxidase n=1 Tax=Pseudomonas mangiferae TaxID=2593654 RepID=A0A553H4Z5_9PSED|nr:pyridoxal 5'-phosphate synthase [Pseudomonas mangiferae]TRX76843.1 pyridoxamine 5'-phosphate oxidase [Pseudomonas mangiferae]